MKDDKGNPLPESDLKWLRRWVWVFLIISLVGGLASAWLGVYKRHNPDPPHVQAEKIAKDPMALRCHVRINGVDLWIPVGYFESRIPLDVDQKSVLLITLHPDFEPLKKSQQQVRQEGQWYRKVRWLIQDVRGMKSLSDNYASISHAWKATEFKSMEYGLRYYSQPADQKNDFREVWLEGSPEDPQSFIECGKQLTDRSHPQCSHSVWTERFRYRISFDKQLLPHWREIQQAILALTDEFERKPLPQINDSSKHRKGP